MDWVFLVVVGAVIFSMVMVALALRYLLARRLERLEQAQARAEDERVISESNSGL